MELVLRLCTDDDIDTLVEISKETFTTAFEKDNDPKDFENYINTAFNSQTLLEQIRNVDSVFYFTYVKGQLIGYIKINQHQAQTDVKLDHSMELERIYVVDAFQNKGYGKLILNKVIQLGLKANKKFLWLGVWERNLNAIRFYERLGFVKFATHPYYIGTDKQTDWLMRLDLI